MGASTSGSVAFAPSNLTEGTMWERRPLNAAGPRAGPVASGPRLTAKRAAGQTFR